MWSYETQVERGYEATVGYYIPCSPCIF